MTIWEDLFEKEAFEHIVEGRNIINHADKYLHEVCSKQREQLDSDPVQLKAVGQFYTMRPRAIHAKPW